MLRLIKSFSFSIFRMLAIVHQSFLVIQFKHKAVPIGHIRCFDHKHSSMSLLLQTYYTSSRVKNAHLLFMFNLYKTTTYHTLEQLLIIWNADGFNTRYRSWLQFQIKDSGSSRGFDISRNGVKLKGSLFALKNTYLPSNGIDH